MDAIDTIPSTLTRSIEVLLERDPAVFERIRAELFRQAFTASLWDISSDGLLVSDHEGVIIAANPRFCKLFNVAEDHLVGRMMWYPSDGTAPEPSDPVDDSRIWVFPLESSSVLLLEISTYQIVGGMGPVSISVFHPIGRSPQTTSDSAK